MNWSKKPALRVLMLLSALSVTGCSHLTNTAGTDTYCRIAEPITWSSRDTAETVVQIKTHNAVYEAVCP